MRSSLERSLLDGEVEVADIVPRLAPGKVSLTSRLPAPMALQFRGQGSGGAGAFERAASGVSGSGAELPHRDRIQQSFGRHDVTSVRAHTGDRAELAARQLRAEAFAFGVDVAFAGPAPDLFTAAHEAAHVVQQRAGIAPSGGLGSAGDGHERQADAVADAVVRGESAEPLLDQMSGGHLASAAPAAAVQALQLKAATRSPDADAEEQWARDARAKIRDLQKAAVIAGKVLARDAATAVRVLSASQDAYQEFERRYYEAVGRFTDEVHEAKEQAEQLKEMVWATVSLALALVPGAVEMALAPAALKASAGIIKKVEAVDKLLVIAEWLSASGEVADAEPAKEPPEPGPSADINWGKLLQTSIATLEKYTTNSTLVLTIIQKSTECLEFLGAVLEGDGPKNPMADPRGRRATRVTERGDLAISELTSIQPGAIAEEAVTFGRVFVDRLRRRSDREIEQDIAIRWISSLSDEQLGVIDTADGYLAKLGVIDGASSRLGHDTGSWTTAADTRGIRDRARMEATAMGMIGKLAEWVGWKDLPLPASMREHFGTIRAEGKTWNAQLDPEGWNGGPVRIVAYQIAGDGQTALGRDPHERILFRVETIAGDRAAAAAAD